MKPSSIDDPVARYRPRTGSATNGEDDGDRQPPVHDRIAEPRRRARTARRAGSSTASRSGTVEARRSSPEMVPIATCHPALHRPDPAVSSSRCPMRPSDAGSAAGTSTISPDWACAGSTRWRGATSTTPTPAGREVHADEFMRRWAEAGLDITHRTSAAVGQPATAAATATTWSGGAAATPCSRGRSSARSRRSMGPYDAIVEIWNGVPWFSPVWCRRAAASRSCTTCTARCGIRSCPGRWPAFGRALEARLAPPFYRRSLTVTPSDATRDELIELGFAPGLVTAVPNGTDPMFSPGGRKTPVAVDRGGRDDWRR